jgi:hypothetical protein
MGDADAVKRCQYVMDQTSPYRGEERAINYGVIPASLLESRETNLLEGGEDDV